jgi:hypothetical protein
MADRNVRPPLKLYATSQQESVSVLLYLGCFDGERQRDRPGNPLPLSHIREILLNAEQGFRIQPHGGGEFRPASDGFGHIPDDAFMVGH